MFYSDVVVKSEQVGLIIKAAREEVGMGQPELAYKANISPSTLSSIELGKSRPGFRTLARLAAVLNIPASTFDSALYYEIEAAREEAPANSVEAMELREQQKRMEERLRERHTER